MPGSTTDVPDAVPIAVVQESLGQTNGDACEEEPQLDPEGLTCKECKGTSKTIRCCGGCWQVWYCSRAHQVSGWAKHKLECKPFKIASTPELGRYLVATRDISRGDLILEDKTLIMGPKTITEPVCLACYRPVDGSFTCPQCGFPMCNSDCASADSHEPECKAVRESGVKVTVSLFGKTNCMYECIMPVRILALRDGSPNIWRKIINLESHAEKRGDTEVAAITQRTVVDIIKSRLALDYSDDVINQVLGVIDTNGFEIRLPDSSIMGVYGIGALLEHSCIPNTHRTFDADLNLVVRAAFDLKRGEHLQSCYTESLSSTIVRQEHLLTSKFFTCNCLRCLDPTELGTFTSAMLCPTCSKDKPKKDEKKKDEKKKGEKDAQKKGEKDAQKKGEQSSPEIDPATYGVVVPEDPSSPSSPWVCLSCNIPMDSDCVSRMTSVMTEEAEELDGDNVTIKVCEAFLEKWSAMYHQNNAAFLNVKYQLVHLYGNEDGYTFNDMSPIQVLRKEALSRQLLKVADIICPGISRLRGSVLYELYQALFYKSCSMYQSGIIPNDMARMIATEAYDCLLECARVLSYEPPVQPEGQLGIEAKVELRNMIRWMKEEGWKG